MVRKYSKLKAHMLAFEGHSEEYGYDESNLQKSVILGLNENVGKLFI